MELSCKFYHINGGISNQNILKLSIVKNLDQFNMLIELYSLNVQDETTLNIVVEHVAKSPTNKTLLRKIDNKLIDSIHLNYYEIESYLPVLKTDLTNIIANFRNDTDNFNFRICNKFDVIFNVLQIKRLYADLYGFYQNYMVLDALFKLTVENTNKKPEIERISVHKDVLKNENETKKVIPPVITPVYTEENTKFDNLLTLCINQSMKSLIIDLSCNYYVYISKNNCFVDKISDENLIKIQACSLFSNNYIYNSDYIKSIIMSLTIYNNDNIMLRLNKLMGCLLTDGNSPVEIMAILGMMYLYYIVLLYNSHSAYFLSNIVTLFCDVVMQSRLFNNHTKLYLKNNNVHLFLDESSAHSLAEKDENFNISAISKKYEHLITVSESEFVNKVIEDLNNTESNSNILLNSKRIINLHHLKSLKTAEAKKEQNITSNSLLDPENELDFDQEYSNLFCYDFEIEHLTLANQYFNMFTQNQSEFLIKYKQKQINTNLVPVNVINMFGIVKQLLFDQNSTIHKTINTYMYYKILVEKINDPTVFPHTMYLFIIYQIIIPFMFINYQKFEFESTF